MATTTLQSNASALIKRNAPNTNFSSDSEVELTEDNSLLVSFTPIAESLRYKRINSITLYVYASQVSDGGYVSFCALDSSFSEQTVTYNTAPDDSGSNETIVGIDEWAWESCIYQGTFRRLGDFLRNGARLFSESYYESYVKTTRHANKPYIEVSYENEDVSPYISTISPTAGYYSNKAPTVFTWGLYTDGESYSQLTQASAKIRWRENESSTVNEIQCGTENTYTVPANTFPNGSYQWQVVATDNLGQTASSKWYTITTTEVLSTAVAVSPVDALLDGTVDNVFTWQHVISTGSKQTAYDLQTSTNNSTWETISSATTEETSCVISANTLAGGDLYWRVRTYNTDSVAGSWSDAAHCIVVAAPAAPLIAIVDQSPRFSIRWEQTGQQGYEVMVDGVIVAQRFGAESNYTYDEYLTDGSHTVKVRIQNQYSLWSDWGEVLLSITNTEGEAIALSVQATHVAQLIWQPGEYANYLVYRDGKKIGETKEAGFVDPYSNGSASYQVRGVYSDSGNYGLSNSVTVEIHVPTLMVYDVENKLWLSLEKAATSGRITGISASHNVTYVHYAGQNLPVAEVGEARDRYYNFECAFTHAEKQQAAQFESMLGKVVCIKDQYGNAILSVLDGYSLNITQFYRAFVVTATEIAWDGVTG